MNTHKGNSRKRIVIDMLCEIENAFHSRLSANRRPWTLHSMPTHTHSQLLLINHWKENWNSSLPYQRFVRMWREVHQNESFSATSASKEKSFFPFQRKLTGKLKRTKFRGRFIKREKCSFHSSLRFLLSNFELKWKIWCKISRFKVTF